MPDNKKLDTKKYTFWSLLNTYDKIEIPIIQRDYAQGRSNESKIRKEFISYLLKNLIGDIPIELDFVYGDIRDGNVNAEKKVFIPLDGQQRLTTLFLLHWYIAYKENKLNKVKEFLKKFTYETRPSSHDFISYLCEKEIPLQSDVVSYIKNQASWFDDSWLFDPSVSGMLTVLQEIETNLMLKDVKDELLERLISETNPVINFYFVSLDEFGMGDELYIRMNARGKQLTSFETFKSTFYKVIKDSKFLDEIKTKIEYEWVDVLWEYRNKDEYIIDRYFLNYFNFISTMLYYKDADKREKVALNFNDYETLCDIYLDESNLEFLVFAFDNISTLRNLSYTIIPWKNSKNKNLEEMLRNIIKRLTNDNTVAYFLIFEALSFIKKQGGKTVGIENYLRVVRNLIYNTENKSEREWYNIIPSFEKLISADVYSLLCKTDTKTINGLYNPQVYEEIAKAKLIRNDSDAKNLIHKAEDNDNFAGNISCLIKVCLTDTEEQAIKYNISTINNEKITKELFINILQIYQEIISPNGFELAWGDFINTSVYIEKWDRCNYDEDYSKNISIIYLTKEFINSDIEDFNEFLIQKEKKNIIEITNKYNNDLSVISNLKTQLYLLYIITVRIKKLPINDFFRGDYNFGWLTKEKGYETPFSNNKIIQSYNSQFRYNLGINKWHTPKVLFNNVLESNIFDLLVEWAKTK